MINTFPLAKPSFSFLHYIKPIVSVLNEVKEKQLSGEGIYKRYTGHHGHVKLEINLELLNDDNFTSQAFILADEGQIPSEYHKSIILALNNFSILFHMVQMQYYIKNMRITEGTFHEVDSRASDYEIATYMAIKDAFYKRC